MTSNTSSIILDRDTYVKYERVFCAWAYSQKKSHSILEKSFPSVRKACPKTMTKTGKTTFEEFMET
jgi:hypothetical protein